MRQRGSLVLQTRKIKQKDSEIQAVSLERKKQPNKPSPNEHTPNFCTGLPPEQANRSQSVVGMQRQIRHRSSKPAARLTHFCILQQVACNPLSCELLNRSQNHGGWFITGFDAPQEPSLLSPSHPALDEQNHPGGGGLWALLKGRGSGGRDGRRQAAPEEPPCHC